MKYWLLPVSVCLVAACGGSGSDSEIPATPPDPTIPAGLTISGNTSAQVGDTVDFAVAAPRGRTITAINWQVTGVNQQPLGAHTQAIGFDVTASGNATIEVQATFDNGETLSDSLSLAISENSSPVATVRLGHEAAEGGRVSLRVDTAYAEGLEISDIDWQQVGGPNVSSFEYNDGDYSNSVFFQAPLVSADSIITMQATVRFSNGESAVDTAQVVVKDIAIDEGGFFVDNDSAIPETVTTHMQPYNPNSPYASALRNCVYNNVVEDSCQFSTLPLIGQVTENPTVQDVLDRTYVSHPWMGDAFKHFLETSATQDDMLKLLRATTAVVISYDIRPSFYWVATGAIYLDAGSLWRTPEERDTLNTRPDYRSGFGNDLNFSTSWRYVKNGEYYYPVITTGNASERLSRTDSELEASLGYLLYHELAHANDFFDHTEWGELAMNESPLSSYNDSNPLSTGLDNAMPLTSSELHALADVRYKGEQSSATQRSYTASQVANWFEEDGAVTFYAYSTERQDLATLFERFMMLYRLGASADVGVFSRENIDDGSFVITWGQRDRINDSNLTMRLEYVASRILPNLNVPAIQAQLPEPVELPAGVNWRELASFNAQSGSDIQIPLQAPSSNAIGVMTMEDELRQVQGLRH